MVNLGEIALFGGLGLIVFAGSLIGGFISRLVVSFIEEYRLVQIERRIERLENTIKSGAGVEARTQKAERTSAAVAEAAVLMQEGKKPAEILAELAPKYPDVALDLVKKFSSGKGLSSLKLLG